HQQPFAAHAVEHLQQQRSQQLLRRDRRPPLPRVKLIELRRQLYKHCIRNLTYRSQWMLLWHSLLWREVTEHSRLLQIVSAHLVSFSFVASLYYSLLLRWTMRKSYFFSSLLDKVVWQTTRIVRDVDEIRKMKQQPGKDMHAVGGATL